MRPGLGVVLSVPWYEKTVLIVADEATARKFAKGGRGRIFTEAEVAILRQVEQSGGGREDVRAMALEKIALNGVIVSAKGARA